MKIKVIILSVLFLGNFLCQKEVMAQIIQNELSIDSIHNNCDQLILEENYQAAIALKKKELSLIAKTTDHNHLVTCTEKLALLYYHIGNYHESLRLYGRTFDYFGHKNDYLQMATNRVNAANVYTRIGKYSDAIELMLSVESIYTADSATYSRLLIGLYTNLGLAYFDLPNLDSSMFYYQKALTYNNIVQNERYRAIITNNMGDVHLAANDLESAENCYNTALQISQGLDFIQLVATAKLNLGRLCLKKDQNEQAIVHLKQALLQFQQLQSLFFVAETHKELSLAHERTGDISNSLENLKLFYAISDSIRGTETISRISDLEKEVALQKETRKSELIQRENELATSENRLQRITFYFIGGILLLGLILAFVINRTLKISLEKNRLKSVHLEQKRELLQNKLDFKKREIENFSTYIFEKNAILSGVQNSLIEVQNKIPGSSALKNVLASVNHNLRMDQDRKKLELKIDQAHQEFLDRLTSNYPKLSSTEQRLCSLILMDLNTKDIAVIMNIEPDSVKKSKNRVRKKLNLESGSDITEFLKGI